MTTEKYSGKDFLSAIEAQDGDGKNRKETIFNALFNACGTEFSDCCRCGRWKSPPS